MKKVNNLLSACTENLSTEEVPDMSMSEQPVEDQPVSDEQLNAVMEELNRYIAVVDNISHEVAQNEVNIANLVGSPRPEVVMSPDGEFLAEISPEIQPTVSPSDNIGVVIPLEIAEQNNKVYQNAAGQLNYTGDNAIDQMREDLEIQYNPISMESSRVSPLILYRAHTEGLKETLSKFIEKIKEMIKWIFARLKDAGHSLLLLFEKFNGTKDKLIAKFKEGQSKEKKFKDGVLLSSDTLLTMLTDYPDNLDIALNLQFNVLQPYTKQFIDAYNSGNSKTLDSIINKAKDDLISNRNKEGENFLTKIGVKGTDGFICIVRPGQILKLNLDSSIWSVEKEEIQIDDNLRKKLMGNARPDGMWDDALLYLNALKKVEQVSKNYIKLSNQCKNEDATLLANLNKVEENFINQIKFIYSILKFKKTILDSVLFTPRAIISACTEIYKSIEIKQPNGDYSVMTLPKPVGESYRDLFIPCQEFFGLFGNKSENKLAEYDVVDVILMSKFFEKSYLSKIKSYFDNGAKNLLLLLTNSNKEINADGSKFSKWEKEVKKASEENFKKSTEFSKYSNESLVSLGVDRKIAQNISSGEGNLLGIGVYNYGKDKFYSGLVVKDYSSFSEIDINMADIRHGYNSLSSNEKIKLIDDAMKKLNSIVLDGSLNIWKSYKEIYNRFDSGEWGEYDDNLNSELDWFWAANDSQAVFFDLDVYFDKGEMISMFKNILEEEKIAISGGNNLNK